MSNEASWKGEFRFFLILKKISNWLSKDQKRANFYPLKKYILSHFSVIFQYLFKKSKIMFVYN